ncbi:BNR-4 repeat-containing protein [Spirillospora sp. NPDC047279]|uniref:BNR-4 repeat-containing protein n=1 Tax=Spirillospora sp. NPDC047279 TaxID=3155478 RepID=UPI0033E792BC
MPRSFRGMRVLAGGAAAITAAALALAPAAVAAPAAPALVPYTMDSSNQAGWWSPLDTYEGAGQYAYLAYNEPGSTAGTHRVAIARRDGSGAWSRLQLTTNGTPAEYTDDLGHNQPSLARDGSGRFHVFASMHNNAWRYFRSDTVGGAPTGHSADLPDQGKLFTYPVVATAPNGDLYAIARMDGPSSRAGRLYHWDDSAARWSAVATFADTPNRSVYPDDIQVDASGNVHILFEWALFPAQTVRHELTYLKYAPATGTFSRHDGTPVGVPVTTATADVVQPLETGEAYRDSTDTGPTVQSAKVTLNGTSPRIAYRYRTPSSGTYFNVRYAYPSGASWARQTVYSAGQTRAALDITWDPALGKRVYYVLESGTDRVFSATESGGAWTRTSVAPGLPIQRIAVKRDTDGDDVLYLADPTGQKLYYGRS